MLGLLPALPVLGPEDEETAPMPRVSARELLMCCCSLASKSSSISTSAAALCGRLLPRLLPGLGYPNPLRCAARGALDPFPAASSVTLRLPIPPSGPLAALLTLPPLLLRLTEGFAVGGWLGVALIAGDAEACWCALMADVPGDADRTRGGPRPRLLLLGIDCGGGGGEGAAAGFAGLDIAAAGADAPLGDFMGLQGMGRSAMPSSRIAAASAASLMGSLTTPNLGGSLDCCCGCSWARCSPKPAPGSSPPTGVLYAVASAEAAAEAGSRPDRDLARMELFWAGRMPPMWYTLWLSGASATCPVELWCDGSGVWAAIAAWAAACTAWLLKGLPLDLQAEG